MLKRVFIAGVTTLLLACGGGDSELNDVTYSISGTTTKANATWVYFDGSISQHTLPVPYETSKLLFKSGDFLYLSAQNDLPSGTVTTTIKVNGKAWKTVTSSGAYSIATVSGTCC
jgi:hypothetical protein